MGVVDAAVPPVPPELAGFDDAVDDELHAAATSATAQSTTPTRTNLTVFTTGISPTSADPGILGLAFR
jgi:hypothetical protein